MSTEEVDLLLNIDQDALSMKAPADENGKMGSLHDCMADPNPSDIEEQLCERKMKSDIQRAFTNLSTMEAQVLSMHYNLGEEAPMILEEIGTFFNRTRKRMRQVKKKALAKLQRSSPSRSLR